MLITIAGTILKGLWQGVLLWEAFIGEKKKFPGAFCGDLSWAGGVEQAGNWGGQAGIFILRNVQALQSSRSLQGDTERRKKMG